MNSKFKKTYPFKDRKKESLRILSKYPKRIPVICQTNSNNIKYSDIYSYILHVKTICKRSLIIYK